MPSITAFRVLPKETQTALIDYIEGFSIYEEITVEGRRFHLSHTLPDYRPEIRRIAGIRGEAAIDGKYLAGDEAKLEKLFEEPWRIKTPVVRNGREATVGYQPEIWKSWN